MVLADIEDIECILAKHVKAKEVQPERKKGKWIDKSGGIEGAWNYCSVCGEQAIDLYDFCPNCGADMRGENDEVDKCRTASDSNYI
jgi:hypothetical protein